MDLISRDLFSTCLKHFGHLCFAWTLSLSLSPQLWRYHERTKSTLSLLWKNFKTGVQVSIIWKGGRSSIANAAIWCRYYKGLGTSTAKEGKEYFSNLEHHVLPFAPITSAERNLIDMCFKRSRSEERKEWIDQFDPTTFIDYRMLWYKLISRKNSHLYRWLH